LLTIDTKKTNRAVINSGSLTFHSQTHPAFLYSDAGHYRYYARLQLDSVRSGFECCRIFLDFRAQIWYITRVKRCGKRGVSASTSIGVSYMRLKFQSNAIVAMAKSFSRLTKGCKKMRGCMGSAFGYSQM